MSRRKVAEITEREKSQAGPERGPERGCLVRKEEWLRKEPGEGTDV